MKTYTKPVMHVELFVSDRTVAATSCNRINTGSQTTTTYTPQTVNCIVSGSESIFTASTAGCSNPVDVGSQGSKWYFTNYNGVDYFVWYDGKMGGQPNSSQQAILAGCGISAPGWHAATYTVTTNIQQLFGFSY